METDMFSPLLQWKDISAHAILEAAWEICPKELSPKEKKDWVNSRLQGLIDELIALKQRRSRLHGRASAATEDSQR